MDECRHQVPVREFNVIYHLIDDIKTEISDRLPPADVEDVSGRATVLQEFLINEGKRKVSVAGCRVVSGRLARSARYRLLRGEAALWEGELASLKIVKEEVSEVASSQECGIKVRQEEGAEEVRFEPGDKIIAFSVRQEARKSDWDPGF